LGFKGAFLGDFTGISWWFTAGCMGLNADLMEAMEV
jgi:hypothetical protein